MRNLLEENSFGSDILETKDISKALLDKASEEQLLELHRGTSLVSPSLNEKVCELIEDGLRRDDITSTLVGKDDPQREVTDYYPPKFIEKDILESWVFYYSLRRLKLIALQKQLRTKEGKVRVFHGSTEDRRKKLLNEGLTANRGDTGFSRAFRGSKQGYVFLYLGRQNAIEHASYNASQRKSFPILMELEVDPNLLKPDLDNHDPRDSFKILEEDLDGIEITISDFKNFPRIDET